MSKIVLLHNDDEVLDPLDSSLRQRGSLQIDGKEEGSWESHENGIWTADYGNAKLEGQSKAELIARVAEHFALLTNRQ